jgi:hypothetical protein
MPASPRRCPPKDRVRFQSGERGTQGIVPGALVWTFCSTVDPVTFNIELDDRLFTAFALLNLSGYDRENGWEFDPVRRSVRSRLAPRAQHWRESVSRSGLLEPMNRGGGAILLDHIPFLSPPPEFALRPEPFFYLTDWQRSSRSLLPGISQILSRFYIEESVGAQWARCHEAYFKAAALLREASDSLSKATDDAIDFDDRDRIGVNLVPNLLDVRRRGYSLSSDRITWLFLGGIQHAGYARELILHELLHRWVDPAAERFVSNRNVGDPDPMPLARARFRMVAESYPELAIWTSEITVRAATVWMISHDLGGPPESIDKSLSLDEKIGLVGVTRIFELISKLGKLTPDSVQASVQLAYRSIMENFEAAGELD